MTSIVFMGTPKFSAPILEGLIREGYDVKAVVTQPDRYVGRKHVLTASPVKETAARHGIEVLQPEKLSGSAEMDRIIELKPDLIVTAAFGQFLPNKLIEAAKVAAINVHGSLLPKYRGGAPVQYAIMNGDSETGVTIIYMVRKMDAGAMLAQAKMPIEENDDTATVFQKMSILGRDTLLETILIGKSGRCVRVRVLILLIFWESARNFGIFPFWMKKLPLPAGRSLKQESTF